MNGFLDPGRISSYSRRWLQLSRSSRDRRIAVSTGGDTAVLFLSTPVLFLGPKIGFKHFGKCFGVALIGPYVLAIVAGGLIGPPDN